MATTNSDHDHPKIIESTFSFPEFAPECKISVHFIYSFLRYSQFQSPATRLAMPIFNHVHPKIFWSTFNLRELVSPGKKSGYFIDLVWRYGWLKHLQSDWLRIFCPISQEQKCSQIWDLCGNTANYIVFIREQIQ